MILPEYSVASVAESLELYTRLNNGTTPYIFEMFGIFPGDPDYTVEKFIECYHQATTFTLPYRTYIALLCDIRDRVKMNDNSRAVLNKLIGDRKLFHKVLFCTDGSYRNNRIWGRTPWQLNSPNEYELLVNMREASLDIISFNRDLAPKTVKKNIDWLYHHFDTIFLQIPPSVDYVRYPDDTYAIVECDRRENISPDWDDDW